jgi:hypothetical protein
MTRRSSLRSFRPRHSVEPMRADGSPRSSLACRGPALSRLSSSRCTSTRLNEPFLSPELLRNGNVDQILKSNVAVVSFVPSNAIMLTISSWTAVQLISSSDKACPATYGPNAQSSMIAERMRLGILIIFLLLVIIINSVVYGLALITCLVLFFLEQQKRCQ